MPDSPTTLADVFADLHADLQTRPDLADALAALEASDDAALESERAVDDALRAVDVPALALLAARATTSTEKLALAQAIDGWYGAMRASLRTADDEFAEPIAIRLDRDGKLNADPERGVVAYRRPLSGRWADPNRGFPGDTAEADREPDLVDAFEALFVLPPTIPATDPDDPAGERAVRFDFLPLGRDAEPLPGPGEVLRVGFLPLATAVDDIGISRFSVGDREVYDAVARPLSEAVASGLEALSEAGCHLIVLPEMAVHADTLEVIRAWLRTRAADTELRYVLAGTSRTQEGTGPPRNRAHLLNASGESVAIQDKLARWNLSADLARRYGLPPCPEADGLVHEHIAPGDRITVVEIPEFGRLAILICEDLDRSEPGTWLRRNALLDLQITPVLDSGLSPGRWAGRAGARATATGRCRVIVANSAVLTHRQNAANAASGDPRRHADYGVGLCLDETAGGIACLTSTLSLDGDETHCVVDWCPQEWSRFEG